MYTFTQPALVLAVALSPTQTLSSRPEAALLPPKWRDLHFAVALVFVVVIDVALVSVVVIAFLVVIPAGDLLLPSSACHQSNPTTKSVNPPNLWITPQLPHNKPLFYHLELAY